MCVCGRGGGRCVSVCKPGGQEYSIITMPLKIKVSGAQGAHKNSVASSVCVCVMVSFTGCCSDSGLEQLRKAHK